LHSRDGLGELHLVKQYLAARAEHVVQSRQYPARGHHGVHLGLGRALAEVRSATSLALFVNEATLLPLLVPLAPSATLLERFVPALGTLLSAHGSSPAFVGAEAKEMAEWRLAKTTNRSTVGTMNEFTLLAGAYAAPGGGPDLVELSLRLAKTPCGPLYKRNGSPDRELAVLLSGRDAH
jgi:hypothetical protein